MTIYRRIRKLIWKASILPFPTGWHITRYSMYRSLSLSGRRLTSRKGRVLSISHSSNLMKTLGLEPSEYVAANYPDYNMLKLSFPDESFDFVVSDQVLEHLQGDPQHAIDESYRVLRPNGIAVHTTCFINPIHAQPCDYWRFTPDALRLLHASWSEVIETGSWGNRYVWSVVEPDGMRFEGVPHIPWHPLHRLAVKNDPTWPIVTWVIAKK